mmetsp:Transcript_11236/g.46834  ORF Transcript_11236/g.46834 Transcript_11236/m.46834 type:complete len:207 (-) Transcript_11236:1447-2067(-)
MGPSLQCRAAPRARKVALRCSTCTKGRSSCGVRRSSPSSPRPRPAGSACTLTGASRALRGAAFTSLSNFHGQRSRRSSSSAGAIAAIRRVRPCTASWSRRAAARDDLPRAQPRACRRWAQCSRETDAPWAPASSSSTSMSTTTTAPPLSSLSLTTCVAEPWSEPASLLQSHRRTPHTRRPARPSSNSRGGRSCRAKLSRAPCPSPC